MLGVLNSRSMPDADQISCRGGYNMFDLYPIFSPHTEGLIIRFMSIKGLDTKFWVWNYEIGSTTCVSTASRIREDIMDNPVELSGWGMWAHRVQVPQVITDCDGAEGVGARAARRLQQRAHVLVHEAGRVRSRAHRRSKRRQQLAHLHSMHSMADMLPAWLLGSSYWRVCQFDMEKDMDRTGFDITCVHVHFGSSASHGTPCKPSLPSLQDHILRPAAGRVTVRAYYLNRCVPVPPDVLHHLYLYLLMYLITFTLYLLT